VLYLSPIFAFVAASGMEKASVEICFVAEKKKPFAIGVESADRVNVFWKVEGCEAAPL